MVRPYMVKILWGSEQPIRPTGYGIVTRNLVKRLVQRGHEVFVMGWDYNGEPMKHEEGWTMVHAGVSGYGGEPISDPRGPTVLDKHLFELEPDVYVTLNDPWYCGNGVISTNNAGIPYIGYLPIDGYPIATEWRDILKMMHTPLWMSKFGQATWEGFVESHGSKGDATKEHRDAILDRFLSQKTDVLYHGVDLDIFKPVTPERKKELKAELGLDCDFAFLCVARNTNRKQHPRLLEAFRKFLDRKPEARVKLILHCGDPGNDFGMGGWKLPTLIARYGLTDHVVFSDNSSNPLLGISTEDMAKLYQASDCHVMSTGGEGFGVPSAEAMACGIPIILPMNSTGPELVGVHQRGWLVDCATTIMGPQWAVNMGLVDVNRLRAAMEECYDDEEMRSARGSAGRKFAEENFDWEMLTDKFEKIMTKAIMTPHPLGGRAKVRR